MHAHEYFARIRISNYATLGMTAGMHEPFVRNAIDHCVRSTQRLV